MASNHNSISDGDIADIINGPGKIMIFCGAGISAASGLPTFRGSDGHFAHIRQKYHIKNGKDTLHYDQVFGRYYASMKYGKPDKATLANLAAFFSFVGDFRLRALRARPNRFHKLMKSLSDSSRLAGVITTNIDDLEVRAGVPPDQITQMHGSMSSLICEACRDITPFTSALATDCSQGKIPFHIGCRATGTTTRPNAGRPAMYRPRVLLYGGDPLNGQFFSRYPPIPRKCTLIIAGASLPTAEIVKEVKFLCKKVTKAGGQVVIANIRRSNLNLGTPTLNWVGDLTNFPYPRSLRSSSTSGSATARVLQCNLCAGTTRRGTACKLKASCRLGCSRSCYHHATRHIKRRSCQD